MITVKQTPFLSRVESHLDSGETAAIALAIQQKASLLLVDEYEGRKTAILHQIPLVGTLGILLQAKKPGFLPKISPLLNSLEKIHFHLSETLRNYILQEANE